MDQTIQNNANNVPATGLQSGITSTSLKVAQINLLHCKKATYTYCRDIRMKQTSITMIQEPWIRGNKVHGFGQMHDRLFYYRKGARPRAAIHVSSEVNALALNQLTDDDLVAVRICRDHSEGGDFVVASVYLPFDSPVPLPGPALIKVIEFCEREHVPLLIGMDSNSHHRVWGSSDINQRGEDLLEYVLTTNLVVLNRGNRPTFENVVRKECIDVTLVSSGWLEESVRFWRVTDDETFSDHKLIRFEIEGCLPLGKPFRNPRKTDWDMYRRLLGENLKDLPHTDRYLTKASLEEANDKCTAAMIQAYEAACPLRNPRPLYKSSLWSDELDRKKKELRKAWNRAGKPNQCQEENKSRYRTLLKEYKQAQEDLKERKKREFFEEANSVPDYARVHRLLAKDKTAQVGSLLKPDGVYTRDSKETAEHLLQTHFPGSSQPGAGGSDVQGGQDAEPSRRDWSFAERLTKKGKVKQAVFKFYSFKSAGLDGVFPALLKEGIDLLLDRLRSIFSSSLALSYVPKLWEKVRVAFIPKPGKASHCEAKDFRPISLASFMLKSLERLLDFYIRGEVLSRYPLHANQHAYQVGKSTDTALHQMTHKIESMLKDGRVALGCFMDVEGAFDNTEFGVITKAARDREVDSLAIRWIVKMLSGRTVEATICGTTIKLGVTRGCPQGGILSPILWCMVIDSLLVKLNDSGLFTQGYSDDVSTLICGDFVDTIGDLMRAAIRVTEEWCLGNNLRVNPLKTKIVFFSRRRAVAASALGCFTVFGKVVELKASVKYLGVIFDHRLTWILHLEEKLRKGIGIFWLCRNAFGRTWGLSPKAVWWIYTAVVRPIMCHGCLVWWPRVDVHTAKKKLDKLQRLACLCMTGGKSSTATASLEVLLALPPLDLFVKSVAYNASANIRYNGWWSSASNVGHSSIVSLIEDDRLLMPSDQTRVVYALEDNFDWSIPTEDRWLEGGNDFPPPGKIVCFTDGSKRGGLTGAGYLCDYLGIEHSLSTGSLASVFQTELFAVSELCAEMQLSGVSDKEIYICTDSQSAIQAVSSPYVRSRTVLDCKDALNALGGSNKVTILWVPGHEGIEGNERADELARKGAESDFVGPEPMFGISESTRKAIVREWLFQRHKERWQECEGCRHTKLFCSGPSVNLSKSLLDLGRRDIKRVIEAVTDHCGLNKHLFDIGCAENPKCLCGYGAETGSHVISDCPRYRWLRKKFLGKPELYGPDLNITSMDLTSLVVFLKKTGRFP